MRVCAILLLLLSTAASTTAAAQSLAEVARKESERREAVKASGKTYTNTDLKAAPAPPLAADSTAAGGDAGAGAVTGSPAADTPEAGDDKASTKADSLDGGTSKPPTESVKDEAYWSKRMAELRERLERDQTFADALQNRIDSLTTDFVSRDDPAQRGQIGADRQKAMTELDRMKKTIEQDKRAIPELEEEARRAGVPPGWLR